MAIRLKNSTFRKALIIKSVFCAVAVIFTGCVAGGLFVSHSAPPCFEPGKGVRITLRVAANAGDLRKANDQARVHIRDRNGSFKNLDMSVEKASELEKIWDIVVVTDDDATQLAFFFDFKVDNVWYKWGTAENVKTIARCEK